MIRSSGMGSPTGTKAGSGFEAGLGFAGDPAPVASGRLTNAVAAMLVMASLSMCVIVALTMLSAGVSVAMPLPT